MYQVDHDSTRLCAYDPSGQPLYVYLLYDYEDRMVLASKQKVSQEQLKEAINEAYAVELEWNRKTGEISRKYDCLNKDLTPEEAKAADEAYAALDKEDLPYRLEIFLARKFGMYPFVFEAEAFQRPDNWAELHTAHMDEEWKKDEKAREANG